MDGTPSKEVVSIIDGLERCHLMHTHLEVKILPARLRSRSPTNTFKTGKERKKGLLSRQITDCP